MIDDDPTDEESDLGKPGLLFTVWLLLTVFNEVYSLSWFLCLRIPSAAILKVYTSWSIKSANHGGQRGGSGTPQQ